MKQVDFTVSLRHDPSSAVESHGWSRLQPFDYAGRTLHWTMCLPGGLATDIRVRWGQRAQRLAVRVVAPKVTTADVAYVRSRVRWMFRADERFEDFWSTCTRKKHMNQCCQLKLGAMLRSPSVFEDIIKTLCTVNCTWRNTITMVQLLCERYGSASPTRQNCFSFPTPGSLAEQTTTDLRNARVGFRARYIKKCSEIIASGELSVDDLINNQNAAELRDSLLSLPGIGSYGANHILMLLGHYQKIPCDSEVCAYLGLPTGTSQSEVERLVSNRYRTYGEFAFLGYRFERYLARKYGRER
jgi:3-methyladenine DNA glycosylase/8-oxoguanine DNA glycosylase